MTKTNKNKNTTPHMNNTYTTKNRDGKAVPVSSMTHAMIKDF
jgi:hypothetical protein